MEILSDFGVKPILLIAQIVNFVILLWILKRFLYKPLLKVLEERKIKIADSLKNAEEIEARLQKIGEDREKELTKAAKEAQEIIDEAAKNAQGLIAEAHSKAAAEADRVLVKSHEQLKLEKEKLQSEMRAELSGLVAAGLEKVTGKVLSKSDQKGLIDKSLESVS